MSLANPSGASRFPDAVGQRQPGPGTPGPLAGCVVLVVDDEVLIASLLAQELLELGAAEAFEAHGGAEAIAILRGHPEIAAMVCDIRMPGMDGTALAHQALALAPSLKVVFVTGYSAGLDTGCWPVLDKPVNPDRLAATLRHLLGP